MFTFPFTEKLPDVKNMAEPLPEPELIVKCWIEPEPKLKI
jgi:hypothetical protein